MWNRSLVRRFGALLAVLLMATACASTATTTSANDLTNSGNSLPEAESVDSDNASEGDSQDHDDADHGDDEHSHVHNDNGIEVDAFGPIPAVDIEVTETEAPGVFDLVVSLDNFTPTPENIDADPIDNEGHMHLYIDGERVQRFTELELEIDVANGEHLVEVGLNANNHADYTLDGEHIRAGQTVTGFGTPDEDSESERETDAVNVSDADVVFTATYATGTVELDRSDRLEVARGDVVMMTIASDTAEEVHVHGYDLFGDVAANAETTIVFTADTPGRFEIEFERSGQFIAELVVS